MDKVIGVLIDEEVEWHAPGIVQGYDTMCGLDASDASIGHGGTVTAKRGQKITCGECKSIWERTVALKLRETNFQ